MDHLQYISFFLFEKSFKGYIITSYHIIMIMRSDHTCENRDSHLNFIKSKNWMNDDDWKKNKLAPYCIMMMKISDQNQIKWMNFFHYNISRLFFYWIEMKWRKKDILIFKNIVAFLPSSKLVFLFPSYIHP